MSIQSLIDLALAEDIGSGDITTNALVPEGARARMALVAQQALVMAGGEVAAQVFRTLNADVKAEIAVKDSAQAEAGAALVVVEGSARVLLTGERVALNLLQRMCGVATLTRAYVDAVAGTKAKILDTRKTMPGLRALDKYAVACGGGVNHRFGLYDAAMVKDNHVALMRGFRIQDSGFGGAVERIRSYMVSPESRILNPVPLIIECDTLEQVQEALAAKPDRILLDNMTNAQLREAVALVAGRIPLEASGGVSLATVRGIAETGVDFISVGALTHSAPAADIGGEMVADV